jgi:hypothetical protein
MIYIILLGSFIFYQAPIYIMEIIKITILSDILFNILYDLVIIRNHIIVLYIMWLFVTILPEQYYLNNLLKRYTVHRYGLID